MDTGEHCSSVWRGLWWWLPPEQLKARRVNSFSLVPQPNGSFPQNKSSMLTFRIGSEKEYRTKCTRKCQKCCLAFEILRKRSHDFPQNVKRGPDLEDFKLARCELISVQFKCKEKGLYIKLETPYRHMVICTVQLWVVAYLFSWGAHGNNKYAAWHHIAIYIVTN